MRLQDRLRRVQSEMRDAVEESHNLILHYGLRDLKKISLIVENRSLAG